MLRLDEDREGPVVDQRDLHHRPELAGQRRALHGPRRGVVAGAVRRDCACVRVVL